jgi:hypothetical protein
MHAGQDLHEGRFAGAVCAHQNGDFPRCSVQVQAARTRLRPNAFSSPQMRKAASFISPPGMMKTSVDLTKVNTY